MPRTRSTVNRNVLENATMEQLQKEARRYHLPVSGDRSTLIDTILSYLERGGPDEPMVEVQESSKGQRPEAGATAGTEQLSAEVFRDTMIKLQESIALQQKEMQENFVRQQAEMQRQQQQFMLQIVQQLSNGERAAHSGRNSERPPTLNQDDVPQVPSPEGGNNDRNE